MKESSLLSLRHFYDQHCCCTLQVKVFELKTFFWRIRRKKNGDKNFYPLTWNSWNEIGRDSDIQTDVCFSFFFFLRNRTKKKDRTTTCINITEKNSSSSDNVLNFICSFVLYYQYKSICCDFICDYWSRFILWRDLWVNFSCFHIYVYVYVYERMDGNGPR